VRYPSGRDPNPTLPKATWYTAQTLCRSPEIHSWWPGRGPEGASCRWCAGGWPARRFSAGQISSQRSSGDATRFRLTHAAPDGAWRQRGHGNLTAESIVHTGARRSVIAQPTTPHVHVLSSAPPGLQTAGEDARPTSVALLRGHGTRNSAQCDDPRHAAHVQSPM